MEKKVVEPSKLAAREEHVDEKKLAPVLQKASDGPKAQFVARL